MSFSPEKRERILSAIESRGATGPCQRCGKSEFDLENDYIRHDIQLDKEEIKLGGSALLSYGLICVNCGSITFHIAKALMGEDY